MSAPDNLTTSGGGSDTPTGGLTTRRALWIAAALAAGAAFLAVVLLILRLDDPLLENHAFRQTQTAISVWTILHGGPVIDYLTPVAGAPWMLPFEAPVYHIAVATLETLTPLGLDAAGRVASFLFLVGTIAFGAAVIGELMQRNRVAQLAFVALMFASPQYLFWGEAFLIETCATFFGSAMLYGCIVYSRKPSITKLGLVLIAAVLCALTKTTTWLVFALACGAHWTALVFFRRSVDWRMTGALAAVAVISGVSAVAWTAHADALKASGLFTSELTQSKLLSFHLGGVSIRFRPGFWLDTLPFRMMPDALGLAWPLLFIGLFWAWRRSRRIFHLAFTALLVFFVPLLIVMNAHFVHNYYQTANALFAVAAASVLIGGLVQAGRPIVAASVAGLLIAGQLAHFASSHAPLIARPQDQQPTYLAAMAAREMVPPDRSLYVFGIDQSSEIHYYAERRGVAFTDDFAVEKVQLALANPDAALAGYPLGGVVDCRGFGPKPYPPEFDALVDAFVTRTRAITAAASRKPAQGCEVIAFPAFE